MNQTQRSRVWSFAERAFIAFLFSLFGAVSSLDAQSLPTQLGDLDGDGQITVFDLVRLINHINAVQSGAGVPPPGSAIILTASLRGYADVNGDGRLNQADVEMLADAILGIPISTRPRPLLAEPSSGANQVGVTVRPRVYFPKPIVPATLNSDNFYASFAGRKLPARIVPANDGTFAWLFFETNMPNSLIGMDGQPLASAQVGISVVPPELVKDMLPPGLLQHTFDITVQAPGVATFATPAPMTFPNVFNAPPGTKLNFLSFDHTTGRLVIDGTATVSEDGLYVRTDPGTGITHPGWHGMAPPGSQGRKDVPRRPPSPRPRSTCVFCLAPPLVPFFLPGGPGGPGRSVGPNRSDLPGPRDWYQIDLRFLGTNLSPLVQSIVNNAARRWEQIIVGDLPNIKTDIGLVDDIVIDVRAKPIDGPGRTIVKGDPTFLREGSSLPARGLIEFDETDLPLLVTSGQLSTVVLHEMAHVLGFGTIWERLNHIEKGPPELNNPRFYGTTAILEYSRIFDLYLNLVPIENTGYFGKGTNFFYGARDSHWRESVLGNELMTSLVDLNRFQPLSRITAGSFVDIGYAVRLPAADPYTRPGMLAFANVAAITSDDYGEERLGIEPEVGALPGLRADFGTSESPETPGYTRVTPETVYTPERKFGWLPGATIGSVDRGSNALNSTLTQDFVFTPDATFVLDLTNGLYDVTVTLGDSAGARDQMLLFAEGELRGNVSTLSGHFATNTFRVSVTDQQLTLRFRSISEVALDGLEVNLVQEVEMEDGVAEPLGGHFYFAIENLDTGFVLRDQRNLAPGEALCPSGVFLGPSTRYRQWVFQLDTRAIGLTDFTTPPSGQSFDMPLIMMGPDSGTDSDGDGLTDLAEWIVGTNAGAADSDHDGISDLAEIQQGTDPLSGLGFPTGLIANLPLPGEAKEIVLEGSVLNSAQQMAYLALGSRGLGIVNASQFQTPILVGQLDLPGDAMDVAVDSNFQIAAVAANGGGLHLVNVADPMQPVLLRTIPGAPNQVETVDGVVYAAISSGISAYDLLTGEMIERVDLRGGPITGMAREGSFLYTMDASAVLRVIDISGVTGSSLAARGSLAMPVVGGKLFVGNGIAYICAADGRAGGFATANVLDPDAPTLIKGVDAPNVEGGALAANGSGLAVTVGYVRGPQGQSVTALDVLNVSDPSNTGAFLTRFPLPVTPFSVAIGSGIAFVADGTAGLQVVNYRSFDNQGVAPTLQVTPPIDLDPTAPGIQVEDGSLVTVGSQVSDDVQVRNVELLLNGQVVRNDVAFPWDLSTRVPLLGAGTNISVLQVRATDTGGNVATSQVFTVELVTDRTPPRVVRTFPLAGGIVGAATMVAAHFSEPIDQATLTSSSFRVIWAGTNGVIGDVDDMVVDGGVLTYRSDVNAAFLSFTTSLPPGNYEGVISPPLADLVGNPLARVFSWRFSIIGGKDSDQDGIPDDIEIALGLDPTNASTLNDGIVDGDRDLNGDGLPIRWELLYGYDPRSTAAIYTNPDGSTVTAANYDADFDGLTNLQEYQHGTNPLNADTDGDGWDDKSEIEGGTNPLDRNSQPQITLFVQSNVSFLNALPETPPTNAVWFAASSPVSFLNALEESPPAAALWSASSAVVSFMNALPENPPPETVWSLFSSILTYSNAPAPSSLSLRSKP